jgi:hypothetical protein
MKNQPLSSPDGGSGNYSPLISKSLLEGNSTKIASFNIKEIGTKGDVRTKEEFKS